MIELVLCFICGVVVVFVSLLIVWCADKMLDRTPAQKPPKKPHKPIVSKKFLLHILSIISYAMIGVGLYFAFRRNIVTSLSLCMPGGILWLFLLFFGFSVANDPDDTSLPQSPAPHQPKETPPIPVPHEHKTDFPLTPPPSSADDLPTSREEFLKQGWKEVSYRQDGIFSAGVYTRSYLQPVGQIKKGIFEMAEIGSYQSQSGGYINYNLYGVSETSVTKGKKRSRSIESLCEETAYAEALSLGMNPPYDIELKPAWEPTDRQLNYARDLHAVLPLNPSQYDVSAIISRIVDGDEDPPPVWLSMLAHENNVHFSRFIGYKALLEQCVSILQGRCRAELYVWAVYCRLNHKNISLTEYLDTSDIITVCAEEIISNPAAEKSLFGRDSDDYLKPSKNTNIYKTTVQVLNNHHLLYEMLPTPKAEDPRSH